MMKAIVFFTFLFFAQNALSAETSGERSACDLSQPAREYRPKYSRHFSIRYYPGFKIVTSGPDRYLLSEAPLTCRFDVEAKIITPVKRVGFTSTTYLPALELLREENTLIAFQGKQYIVSRHFSANNLKNLSYKMNPEELIALKADLIMGYASNMADPKQKLLFKKLSLPVVVNKDFEEVSPLARAEWIVFISAFYNKEKEAEKIFAEIENNYRALKEKNEKWSKRSVVVGSIENGFWISCGGKSDLAQLIADAGGELAFKNQSQETQRLSLETLAQKKKTYDVWLPHNNWSSKEERLQAMKKDERYQFVSAAKVFNNNLIRNESGATDYWETAVQRPDLLLQDLSKIVHPEAYKDVELKWYKEL